MVMKLLGSLDKLPSLHEVNALINGESGKRLLQILTRLEKLSKADGQMSQAVDLLRLVKELDDSGGLARLLELLRELGPLVKGKEAKALMGQLSGLQGMLDKLMSE